MSPTTISKAQSTRQKGQQPDPHIPGVAGALFGIFMLAAVLSAILMSEYDVADSITGLTTIGLTLIGIYLLFA
ncbi:MAG: hypothetical protein KJ606_05260, partial [Chloroflexi bacterium]|nr:hypothetical protein [Chloroflexota bacterium]